MISSSSNQHQPFESQLNKSAGDDCQTVADSILWNRYSAEALACHMVNMEDITRTFAAMKEARGRRDILVNNAAANHCCGHILCSDLASYNKTLEVKVRGSFSMSIEAGKLMREQGGGAIFNPASDSEQPIRPRNQSAAKTRLPRRTRQH